MLSTFLMLSLAASPAVSPRAITMMGEARINFRPNQVLASFLVTASNRDQVAAKKASDEKLAKFVRACRDAGVEQRNMMIHDGQLTPEYRGNEAVGFLLNRTVVLTITDMARLDEALTAAVRNGGTNSGGVLLQNTEHLAYETKAQIAAATTARERAKGVIEALGGKLGLPTTVSDRTIPVENVPGGSFLVPPEGPVMTTFAMRELTAISQITVHFEVEAP